MCENEDNNTDVQQRISKAQWILERNLSWIANAEVKVGVILTIDIAQLGGLAAAFASSNSSPGTTYTIFFSIIAAIAAVVAIVCASMAVLPRTGGPENSLIFFGTIANQDITDYQTKFMSTTEEDFLADWINQIHRNAQIACEKYKWVKRSMFFSFFAAIPWIVAIYLCLNQ